MGYHTTNAAYAYDMQAVPAYAPVAPAPRTQERPRFDVYTAARDQSGDLEVMRSVYGADSRIRDLAEDTLGMVEPSSRITLDMSDAAAGAAAAPTAE